MFSARASQGIYAPTLSLTGGDFSYNGPQDLFAYAGWAVINNGGLIAGGVYTTWQDVTNTSTDLDHYWALEAPDYDKTTVQIRLDLVAGDTPDLGGDLVALSTWYDLTSTGASWSLTATSSDTSDTGDYTLRMRVKGTPESEVSARYDLTAIY